MIDFILAALPWIALGVSVAIIIANFAKKPKKSTSDMPTEVNEDNIGKPAERERPKKAEEDNYMSTGMSLGMCLGVALGCSFMNTYGPNVLTYGICFGMLGGMIIGMNIKKKQN